MRVKLLMFIMVIVLSCCFPPSGTAREPGLDTVGVRFGADLTDGHNGAGYFKLYEVFLNYLLPYQWGKTPGPQLRTRLDFNAAALTRQNTVAFVGGIGPGLVLGLFDDRLELEGGIYAAYLSHHTFLHRDLGGPFAFSLHGGFNVYPVWRIGVGYRFEHISNADLYHKNPGLNLHLLELKYRF